MTTRTASIFFAAATALAVLLFLQQALSFLSFAAWPSLPLAPDGMSTEQIILAYGVFPRAAVAILAGAALGLAGALLQRLLRNPIADPSTLGVSAGAQLAIVATTLFYPAVLDGYRALVALAGAGGATALVFLLGWRRSFDPVTMVVSGLLVGITCGALSAAMTLSQGEYLMSLVTWNGGALGQQDWSVASTLSLELLAGLAASILLLRPLALFGLGDSGAKSLGVGIVGIRVAVAVIAVGLAAGVAASVGLVSFVGLAAPALVRGLGVRKPHAIILLSPVAGGLLLWLCDGLVQFLGSSTSETFPTGAMTALIGGPLLLWLLPRVKPVELHEERAHVAGARAPRRWLVLLLAFLPAIALVVLFLARTPAGFTLLSTQDFGDLLPMRWPRLLASAAAGSLLAIAGTILQRLTGNPMASPEVLGVSGGAGVGFAAAITIVPAAGVAELFAGAGIGSMIVMIIVVAFASRRQLSPERLLLAGIAVSSLTSAILSALLAIGDQRSWQILSWLGGSSNTATPASSTVLAVLALVSTGIVLFFTRWLTILPLGSAVPVALGVPVRSARTTMIFVAGLATGAASLLVGPLSFVGLMGPHIAHRAGFTKPAHQLLASSAIGALLMIIADLGARTATFPYELPLGLFAALAGAPYLVWLIAVRR
ncbi:Fe(3+)-hydroxamate ABC transporter permease FhuB [Rhizobium metallidurans]|uniref:Iron complex transport system permease protein n=1 Tax=Rhizobium metallidurans TaxID=1265931 RepID=A0A7W6G983_9HYPH|nr:Fe(3+)-hydroxamate ABC transporter permease FhuB [Rhizobium metallidurans]MBB3962484.1 iron complex transport system permease protein [Rhizobium metallidurans]